MIQGGDVEKGDGTGRMSIYGREFADENLGWRDMEAKGLVCSASNGQDTNSSQYAHHTESIKPVYWLTDVPQVLHHSGAVRSHQWEAYHIRPRSLKP